MSEEKQKHEESNVTPVSALYNNWFLEYASYVILERAVPYIDDGLKPVQRRLMHAMWELEDGRYNKVANIIGHTMKYHPHGDVSIGDALVQLGQKDLVIDTQGNWGNTLTGDSAAASRYIEARLSKFALEVVFNPKTTVWQASYDGRNKEPVTLPVKFPLLLAQGVEGIAVGLACKILPHNFIELLEAAIEIVKGKTPDILPDFPGGGIADFSKYNGGLRGGKIRVRAKIEKLDKKTLCIVELPFGTTTGSLIESILHANDKGKIKIKKVEDNTSSVVEILVHLHPDSSEDLDRTIDALYAFTDCEVSISPNSCVIKDDRPHFYSVNEMLKVSVDQTMELLKLELEIRKSELMESWHFSSLEKIFIENRVYRDIEECTTWEDVLKTIDLGLEPYKGLLRREVTQEDILRLTEIKIKRISRFDAFQADEKIRNIEEELFKVENELNNIKGVTIAWYRNLLKKYGKDKERKTKIESFESIIASDVVVNNQKLYVNREDGFAGYGLKKNEFVMDCSDIDDIIVFREDGTFTVSRIAEKSFVGKGILHIAVFRKSDEDTVYNLLYQDGAKGSLMVKRFTIGGMTREKEYSITKGKPNSKIWYFGISGANDAESLQVILKPKPRLRIKNIDVLLNDILIKGRSAQGNIVSKYPVSKVVLLKGKAAVASSSADDSGDKTVSEKNNPTKPDSASKPPPAIVKSKIADDDDTADGEGQMSLDI